MDHQHHQHHQHNSHIHLADLPDLEYDASTLYQPLSQTDADLGQIEHDHQHAGITTLAEFADMAGSIGQRLQSRLNGNANGNEIGLDDRSLMDRSFVGDEAIMAMAAASGSGSGSSRRPPDESLQEAAAAAATTEATTAADEDVADQDDDDGHVDDVEQEFSIPSHLSTTRMILVPAHFASDPYMEEFEEHLVPNYLQARAREFVFLKHAEKKNPVASKKGKKEKEIGGYRAQRGSDLVAERCLAMLLIILFLSLLSIPQMTQAKTSRRSLYTLPRRSILLSTPT